MHFADRNETRPVRAPATMKLLLLSLLSGALLADMVVVENTTGTISVRMAHRDDVDVRGRSDERSVGPDDIEIERKKAAGFFARATPADGASIDLELEVPYQTSLGLTTTSGKIAVVGMPAALNVETESGDLELALPWYSSYLDFEAEQSPKELRIPNHLHRNQKKGGLKLTQHRRVGREFAGYTKVRVRIRSSRAVELREIPIPDDSPIKLPWQGPEALDSLFRVKGPVRLRERGRPYVKPEAESHADFRADVGLMDLLVHVTDKKGRVLSDLNPSEFRVTENGAPQTLIGAKRVDLPVNIVVFLDWNNSMVGKIPATLQAVDRFLNTLRPDDKMALHLLAHHALHLKPRLTDDRVELRRGLETLLALVLSNNEQKRNHLGGKAMVWDPMLVSMTDELPDHDDELNIFIPITMGIDLFSKVPFSKLRWGVEQMARELNILFYPIAVRDFMGPVSRSKIWGEHYEAGRKHLGALAKAGGGRVFEVETAEQIGAVLGQILEEVGTAYALSYSPTNQSYDGEWRSIRVEVDRPGVTLRYRPSYVARP